MGDCFLIWLWLTAWPNFEKTSVGDIKFGESTQKNGQSPTWLLFCRLFLKKISWVTCSTEIFIFHASCFYASCFMFSCFMLQPKIVPYFSVFHSAAVGGSVVGVVEPLKTFEELHSWELCVFRFYVAYSSCWGSSLINTLKLKKIRANSILSQIVPPPICTHKHNAHAPNKSACTTQSWLCPPYQGVQTRKC